MRLIKREGKAIEAVEAWRKTYQSATGRWLYGEDKRVIYEKLVALGPDPHANDVDRVIGNSSWTQTRCSECGTHDAENILMLGEEPDYESATVFICWPCLSAAADYMKMEVEG